MNIIHPISFKNNLYCCKCGAKGKMVYEESNGKQHITLPIFTASSILCTACDTRYFIKWIWSEEDQDFNPYATDFDVSTSFAEDIKNENNQYKRDLKYV